MGAIALAVAIAMLPGAAMASGSSAAPGALAMGGPGVAAAVPGAWTQALLAKKKKRKKKKSSKGSLTPENASPKRDAIRAAVEADVSAENWAAAASETENNAGLLGDPISYQEAAEYRYKQAEADRDVDAAQQAITDAEIALDILHYYDSVASGDADSTWLPIDPASAGSLIFDVEAVVTRSEELIEEIEAEVEAGGGEGNAAAPGKTKKKRTKRERKPGTVMIAVGSVASAIGAGGIGLFAAGTVISSQKQKEVEGLTLPDEQDEVTRVDGEGNQANLLAYIGAGVAVAGLGAGIPLIVIGVMRRNKGGDPPASARLQVVPSFSVRHSGLALRGRF